MFMICICQGIRSVVGLCKHLCGSGTDAGVRCMMRLMEDEETKEKEEGGNDEKRDMRLEGLVLAPCCAHKARFAEVCSRNLLAIKLNFKKIIM